MLITDTPTFIILTYTGATTLEIPFPFYGTETITLGYRPAIVDNDLTPYTPMVYGIDYTVTGVLASAATGISDSTNAYRSGSLVLTDVGVAQLSPGYALFIQRTTNAIQPFEYTELDNFPAKSHENALGRLTVICQELRKAFEFTLQVPPGLDPSSSLTQILALQKLITDTAAEIEEIKKDMGVSIAGVEGAIANAEAAIATGVARVEELLDRVNAIAQGEIVNSTIYNTRATWTLGYDIASGGILTLPIGYYPTRDVLLLFYNGTVCSPYHSGKGGTTDLQYREVGTDPNALSFTVELLFDANWATDTFDMFVVSSNNIAELESLKEVVQGLKDNLEAIDLSVLEDIDLKGLLTLQTDVTNLQTDVTNLKTGVTAVDTRVTTVDNRVTTVDTRVTTLDTAVNNRIDVSQQVLHLRYQKGTADSPAAGGGTFNAGGWRTRSMNKEIINTIPGASLGVDQFSLPPGTYDISARAPAYRVDRHGICLYDVTHGAILTYGTSEYSGAAYGTQSWSELSDRFTFLETTTLDIRHRCDTTSVTHGLGINASNAPTVHTTVFVQRIA